MSNFLNCSYRACPFRALLTVWVWSLLILVVVRSTHAQVSPALLLKPWNDHPHWADTVDEPLFLNGGQIEDSDRSVGIFYWDSVGRIKFDREDSRPSFSLGYRILTIDIKSKHPALPGGLTDVALVGAIELGQIGDDWTLNLIGGLGSANDNHFRNSDALYGIGALHATHSLDPSRRVHLGVSYHGNRVILPDIPLPYLIYEHQVDDSLLYLLGVPGSALRYRPVKPLAIEVTYIIPVTFGAKVAYYFTEELSVLAEYKNSVDGFARHNRDNRRLFYELRQVRAGVRWATKLLDATAGVGYAFDQSFTTGFDLRDDDTLFELSDEPFLFLTIQGTF